MKTTILSYFRANTVSGRMINLLLDGKAHTVAEIAKVAKPRSADNILQPGGWYAQLRRFGRDTGLFLLEKDGDKLRLKVQRA